ncbi:hypothetical protein BDN67DRAFT_971255 [Paxillus ammoniavirescens]|nr:hypothetical protein BDN67DRAFT_971255 [Paxillus ammoniavirescens]
MPMFALLGSNSNRPDQATSFQARVSVFGHRFAVHGPLTASCLLRVCGFDGSRIVSATRSLPPRVETSLPSTRRRGPTTGAVCACRCRCRTQERAPEAEI